MMSLTLHVSGAVLSSYQSCLIPLTNTMVGTVISQIIAVEIKAQEG